MCLTHSDSPGTAITASETETETETACHRVLRTLLDSASGVLGAVVSTADGRAFAHAFRHEQPAQAARVAAVSSSLLALSESFSREALRSRAQHNSIATDHGTIVIVRVPSNAQAHVLCIWIDRSENFATALRQALDTAERIGDVLDAA